jgi:hypothetical protein
MVIIGLTLQSLFHEAMAMDLTHDLENSAISNPTGDQMVLNHSVPGQSVIMAHHFSLWEWNRKTLDRATMVYSHCQKYVPIP